MTWIKVRLWVGVILLAILGVYYFWFTRFYPHLPYQDYWVGKIVDFPTVPDQNQSYFCWLDNGTMVSDLAFPVASNLPDRRFLFQDNEIRISPERTITLNDSLLWKKPWPPAERIFLFLSDTNFTSQENFYLLHFSQPALAPLYVVAPQSVAETAKKSISSYGKWKQMGQQLEPTPVKLIVTQSGNVKLQSLN